jgi:F0F1-type ATP synthase membrane subunit a
MIVNLSNIFFKFISYWSHLVPQGVPLILGMFLAKIELIRKLIRPLTLSLRLGIKITTGHVLLALIRVIGVNSSIFFLILFLAVFYFFFELFVMFIQAVVYRLLISQYYEE